MSSDFLWGTIVGGNIEAANRKTARAVDNLQEAARIREQGARDIAREKQFQKTFQAASAKMDELRELLREAHGARDVARGANEMLTFGYIAMKKEFKKLHPDPEAAENIIQDIEKQAYDKQVRFLKDKGYEGVQNSVSGIHRAICSCSRPSK